MDNNLLFRSNLPLLLYLSLLIIATNFIFLVVNGMPLEGLFVYPFIISLLLFSTIAAFACKVEIYTDRLKIRYFFPWHKNKCIVLKKSIKIDVTRSLWSFDSHYKSEAFRDYIFYDTIRLTLDDTTSVLKINARFGHTHKIIKILDDISKGKDQIYLFQKHGTQRP